MLRRDCGFTTANLFDTMISAQLLGYPAIGLAALVERVAAGGGRDRHGLAQEQRGGEGHVVGARFRRCTPYSRFARKPLRTRSIL